MKDEWVIYDQYMNVYFLQALGVGNGCAHMTDHLDRAARFVTEEAARAEINCLCDTCRADMTPITLARALAMEVE